MWSAACPVTNFVTSNTDLATLADGAFLITTPKVSTPVGRNGTASFASTI
jgi:hypothetical protein